jgi:hypothetical protein
VLRSGGVTLSGVTPERLSADTDNMGNPAARRREDRLTEAFKRYDAAYRCARPGTRSAADLARARLDLTLLLVASGEELPEDVMAQLHRDASALVVTTPPLDDGGMLQ